MNLNCQKYIVLNHFIWCYEGKKVDTLKIFSRIELIRNSHFLRIQDNKDINVD